MKQFNKTIIILLFVFGLLALSSTVLKYTVGGCSYADLNLTITNASPPDTELEFDCSHLLVNGEYGSERTVYVVTDDNWPDSAFGEEEILIEGTTEEGVEVSAEGYTTYNIIGIVSELNLMFWLVFLLLLVLKIVLFFTIRKKFKQTPTPPNQP